VFAENRAGRIRLAFGPPGSAHTPRISKVVEKNDALPAAGRQVWRSDRDGRVCSVGHHRRDS
jgi:hypothetical protein